MKMTMPGFLSESRFKQYILVLSLAILISIAASIPYLYGFLREDKIFGVYLGRSVVNSADTYIFLSHIESVKQGQILLPNLYTSYPRDAFFIKPIYILIGLVARTFDLNSLLIFHVSRFILSVLFFATLWILIGLILSKFNEKILAFVLVSTSSGLGFFLKEKLPMSVDLWVPEANTFFSTTEAPHFIWSQIGILILAIALLKFHATGKIIFLVIGSIFAALTVLEHPYLIPFILLFPPLFLIISSDNLKAYVINCTAVVALPFLFAVFLYILYQNSDGLSQYNKQVILLTPPVLNVLAGYGILIPLAIYGIIKGKVEDSGRYLLILWAILLAILIYMPFPFQRRLLETFHLPIAISATLAVASWNFKPNLMKLLLIFFLVFLCATNIYQIRYAIDAIAADTSDSYSHHIYQEDLEGLIWIRDNSDPQDLILANFYYSNIIPGIAGRYVYNGHFYNTVDSRNKSVLYDQFIKDKHQRKNFIERNKPRYIFFGKVDPYKQSFSSNKTFKDSLVTDGSFREVWSKDDVYILEVGAI